MAFYFKEGQSAQDWQYEQHLFRQPWRDETDPGMQTFHGRGPVGQNGRPGPYMDSSGNVKVPMTAHGDEGLELLNFDFDNPHDVASFWGFVLAVGLFASGMFWLPSSVMHLSVDPYGGWNVDTGRYFMVWFAVCAWFAFWSREGIYNWELARRVTPAVQEYLFSLADVTPQATDGRWYGPGIYNDRGDYYGSSPAKAWRSKSGIKWGTRDAGGVYTSGGYLAKDWQDYQRPNMLWPPGWFLWARRRG